MNPKATQKKLSVSVREMYVNGSGFRAIERVKKVHHTTVINWVKELGNAIPDTPGFQGATSELKCLLYKLHSP